MSGTDSTENKDVNPKVSSSQDLKTDESSPTSKQTYLVDGPFSATQINPSMTSKEAYFEVLRAWVNQANISQSAMTCFPYYLMANYPQLFQQSAIPNLSAGTGTGTVQNNLFFRQNGGTGLGFGLRGVNNINNIGVDFRAPSPDRRFGEFFDNELRHTQEEVINRNGGYEFIIAPFWKRFVAEIIDSIILLLLKLILTFTIVDLFDLNLNIAFNLDNFKKTIEDEYAEFLSFSSDLLLIEILTKIFVCFYEALWTTSGHIYIGGATPGKILMGIRIIHAEAVVPLPQNLNHINNGQLHALLYPATNPGFRRALLRAIAKNILMALLFPMCFVMLFFKNNRTAYDVMTKTIVVEENPAPVLRRRN